MTTATARVASCLAALTAAAVLGCSSSTLASPGPTGRTCSVELRFVGDGPAFEVVGSGFEPDQPATLTVERGSGSMTLTQTDRPALRTDIRGVVLLELGPERQDVGPNRVQVAAGECSATASIDVPESLFPPSCPAGEPVATGGASADAYAAMVVADAPIGYWRFEEDARPFAEATVGGPGAIQGDGVFGQAGAVPGSRALSLDGDGDWIDIADIELAADFTIEGWISFCGNDITSEDALVGPLPNINFHDATPRLWSGEMDVVFSEQPVVHDRWYHVAVTRAGSEVTLYLDGSVVNSNAFADPFSIGALGFGGDGWTNAQLDEVAIYNHALTPDQLAARFAAAS